MLRLCLIICMLSLSVCATRAEDTSQNSLVPCKAPLVSTNGVCSIPEDMILVYKEEAVEIFKNYSIMKKEYDACGRLEDWKDSMFF